MTQDDTTQDPASRDATTASGDELYDRDVETLNEPNAREMLRLAEVRHEAMFRAALGMDQRASVLAAGFAAAAGALTAAGLAAEKYLASAIGAAVGLAIAAALAGFVCRPQRSHFPGVMPIMWHWTPAWLVEPVRDVALSLSANLQDRMVEMERAQARNGRYLWAALMIAAASPAFGFLAHWAARPTPAISGTTSTVSSSPTSSNTAADRPLMSSPTVGQNASP